MYFGSIPTFLYNTPRLGLPLELFSPSGTEKSGLEMKKEYCREAGIIMHSDFSSGLISVSVTIAGFYTSFYLVKSILCVSKCSCLNLDLNDSSSPSSVHFL